MNKESQKYLKFFRRNLFLIIASVLIATPFGFYFYLRQPELYGVSLLLEINYDLDNINSEISLADEIVSIVRSENIRRSIGLIETTKLVAFKPSPLSINIELISGKKAILDEELTKIKSFVNSKYEVKELGTTIYFQKSKNIIPLIVFVSLGLGIGVFISLLREYLRVF